jgi:hypothetical protein
MTASGRQSIQGPAVCRPFNQCPGNIVERATGMSLECCGMNAPACPDRYCEPSNRRERQLRTRCCPHRCSCPPACRISSVLRRILSWNTRRSPAVSSCAARPMRSPHSRRQTSAGAWWGLDRQSRPRPGLCRKGCRRAVHHLHVAAGSAGQDSRHQGAGRRGADRRQLAGRGAAGGRPAGGARTG